MNSVKVLEIMGSLGTVKRSKSKRVRKLGGTVQAHGTSKMPLQTRLNPFIHRQNFSRFCRIQALREPSSFDSS